MSNRLNILPDPAFEKLKPGLSDRLARIADGILPGQFADLLDPLMCEVLRQGFAEAGADEGTVWLMDEARENLVPAFNTGPHAAALVAKFKQPLNAGLIPMVFASEQPFLENEVWRNAAHSKLLDVRLQLQTSAMIAVPFWFLQSCRGVVSCVRLNPPDDASRDPRGFQPEHLVGIQRTSTLLSQLIEFRLLSRAIGWDASPA